MDVSDFRTILTFSFCLLPFPLPLEFDHHIGMEPHAPLVSISGPVDCASTAFIWQSEPSHRATFNACSVEPVTDPTLTPGVFIRKVLLANAAVTRTRYT
jgi:hypothetical protein